MEEIFSKSEKQKPLVTIAVTTYNSAEYVVETLDSVKAQTYDNIELIITDDGSKDDSVAICREWLEKNQSRFVRTLLIEGENIGVAGNTNRALYAAQGEWWKDLSGDDILPSDAVEKHMLYVRSHPGVGYFFGKEIFFVGKFSDKNFEPQEMPFRYVFFGKNITVKRQFSLLTRHFFGAPTASFGNTSVIKSIGGYNESIPNTEDGPLYLALTKAGVRLAFMDEYSVYKRIHSQSYTHMYDEHALLSTAEINSFKRYSWGDLQAENSTPFWKSMFNYTRYLWRKIIESGNDNRIMKCRFYDFLRKYLNPYKYDLLVLYFEESVLSLFSNK